MDLQPINPYNIIKELTRENEELKAKIEELETMIESTGGSDSDATVD